MLQHHHQHQQQIVIIQQQQQQHVKILENKWMIYMQDIDEHQMNQYQLIE